MALSTGKIINNRYRVVKLVAQGNLGSVYRAWDLNLDRLCALKENLQLSLEGQQQFFDEASILANLSHLNLPRVTDHFTEDQEQYLVMDFVEGENLERVIKRLGAVPRTQALEWIEQICDALSYLHTQSSPIIHRDIKPANIIITNDGRAMLVDFGIAKRHSTGQPTGVGARGWGTPNFAPPEQYRLKGTDARSDVYSLAATIYALLTGYEPIDSLMRLTGQPLISPRQYDPSIEPHIEKAILKAMALDADDRYQNVNAFCVAMRSGKRELWIRWSPFWPIPLIAVIILVMRNLIPPTPVPSPTVTVTPSATIPFLSNTPLPSPSRTLLPTDTPLPTLTSTPVSTWKQGKLALLARHGGGTALYTLDLASQGDPQLLYAPSSDTLLAGLIWSPDFTKIAFYLFDQNWQTQVYVIDVQVGAQPRYLHSCSGSSWSQDGSQVVCSNSGSNSFDIVDANSGALVQRISIDPGAVLPAWSPTQDEIVYAVFENERTSLWRLPLGSDLPSLLAGEASENYAPSWSPDGQWIAYQSTLNSIQSEIWIMDRNGDNSRRITYTPDEFWSRAPSWSPDGKWLAFVSNQDQSIGADYGEIYVVSLTTGEVARISNTGGRIYDWRASWGE